MYALCFALAVFALAGCGKSNAAGDKVIATYTGGQVTQAQFDKFMAISSFLNPNLQQYVGEPDFADQMLQQMIATDLLAVKADNRAKASADADVKSRLDQYTQLFEAQGGKGAFDQQMKQSNLVKADLQHYMQQNFYAIGGAEAGINDKEVKDSFDQMVAADPHAFDIATVSHILIGLQDPNTGQNVRTKEEALKRANEVLDKLKNGDDFGALAKQYSDDGGSKDNGGTYTDAPVSQWVPEFSKAAVELPLNQISTPIETDYGYHIMKVTARSTQTYDTVKEQIRSQLAQKSIFDFIEQQLPALIQTDTLKAAAGAAPTTPGTPGNPTTPSPVTPATPPAGKP
jgi:foldase protein PrsA